MSDQSIMRRAGVKLSQLIRRAADPGGVANRFQLYSKVVSGVTQLFGQNSGGTVYQITPPAPSVGPINELWAPPAVAHPADDEFNTNALNAVWQTTGSGFTPPNFAIRPQPYVNPAGGADVAASFENRRGVDIATDPSINSWLRVQPGSGAGFSGIWQPIDSAAFGGAVPDDLMAWCRFDFGWTNGQAIPNGDFSFGLSFFQSDVFGPGTGFSFADHATVAINTTEDFGTGSRIRPRFYGRNTGVGATVTASEGNGNDSLVGQEIIGGFLPEYVILQRRVVAAVATYDAWINGQNGRLYLGQLAGNDVAGAADAVCMWWSNVSAGPPGPQMYNTDFIRFSQGTPYFMP